MTFVKKLWRLLFPPTIRPICMQCGWEIGLPTDHAHDNTERCWGASVDDDRCWVATTPSPDSVRLETQQAYQKARQ